MESARKIAMTRIKSYKWKIVKKIKLLLPYLVKNKSYNTKHKNTLSTSSSALEKHQIKLHPHLTPWSKNQIMHVWMSFTKEFTHESREKAIERNFANKKYVRIPGNKLYKDSVNL